MNETVIQDKFLWRYIVRPLTQESATPVELDATHLEALEQVKTLIENGEFDQEASQDGRVFYGSFNGDSLLPSLNCLISAIERFGYCCVID
ncbi:hypothetical protein [Lyngbya sp. CCY1209]|uniref:hypothetical protein n=1 Tax=Lyngbya sp. CCY1209 TaxID=2886103 RepID=UPI002D209D47|nr:hypothetical protein [Lyngbya sp. CCY1209]MEB3884036.1 hypothetical protein [Lyngbya sp. CCY1209]